MKFSFILQNSICFEIFLNDTLDKLFEIVAGGKKSAGKPKKNWVDCLEEDCARANIPYGSWTEKAKNRTTWQKSISSLTSVKGK